jgi:hypothetical protein
VICPWHDRSRGIVSIVETNAIMVKNTVYSDKFDQSVIGNLILELKSLLAHNFLSSKLESLFFF